MHRSLRGAALSAFMLVLAQLPPQANAAEDSQKVVASQGGATVTFADIDQFSQAIPAVDRAHFFDDPNRIQSVIANLLLQKQLAAEAISNGLADTPDVLAAKDASKKQTLLAKAEMDRFKASLKVPDLDALANEEFLGHPDRYVVPGRMTVKDIFISTKERSDAEAEKIAADVARQAQDAPATFDALITKYSDDPNKAKNHGVGTIVKGTSVDQAVVSEAKKLPLPGSISAPVKAYGGYHVVMLIDRVAAQPKAFSDVHDEIVSSLKSRFIDEKVRDHLDALRNKRLDANPDEVASLRSRYTQPVVGAQPSATPNSRP